MSGISSGVGLISGINTASLIDQLIAIESRPKAFVQNRNSVLTAQQIAFQEVNAKLLSLKLTSGGFSTANAFNATSATSSDESVLTATTSSSSIPGTYNFSVARLVTSQQTITRGFADKDATAIAPTGGTLTFEFGDAKLETDTDLSKLNGGEGIKRGKVRITDRSGASAIVDLSKAVSVNDVLEAINSADNINVTASVSGDGFVLTDNTGSATTALSVADVSGSGTRASLGLAGAAVGDTLTGTAVNTVGKGTLLASLNDGNGIRKASGVADFQLALRDGTTFNITVGTNTTVENLAANINAATGGAVTLTGSGASLRLTDNTAGGSTFAVTALNGSKAALDLGLLASDGDADGVITGTRVLAGLNSKLLKNLHGGTGVGAGTIGITNRAGVATSIDLSAASSVSDVIGLINGAGAGVTASLNSAGNGLLITDNTGAAASDLIIADVSGTAAADLGLAGTFAAGKANSGNLQFQYINEGTRLDALRGGLGFTRGQFTIRDSDGREGTVDLTQGNEVTMGDVIAEINSRGLAINARINDNGDGILIEDTGTGAVTLKISEKGSSTAKDLGLLGEAAAAGEDFNGSFERTITLTAGATLQNISDAIKNAGFDVAASILNDGSAANPFRLSLNAKKDGKGGAFVFDDGGLGLDASTLNEARNALVFFGSADPAKAIAISSATNSLTGIIPGSTITLKNPSDKPVKLSIGRNTSSVTDAVKKFVTDFNGVMATIKKYDNYDKDKEVRSLLLGDPTLARIQSSLFRIMGNRNGDVTSQYNLLSQVGIKIGKGATLEFDESKFKAAMDDDAAAVQSLFTLKETVTDSEGKTTITKGGVGVRIEELLKNLTDVTVQGKSDQLDAQIKLNVKRIAALDVGIAAKRARLENQFAAMEKALAGLQEQSGSLNQLASLATQARS
jgi:flagellar hook-associated protein 2